MTDSKHGGGTNTRREIPAATAGAETWRYTCPQGHTSIDTDGEETYYCQTCEQTYDGQPVDKTQEGNDA